MRHPPAPRSPDLITLGRVAPLTRTLILACRRCERRGQLSVARLLAEWGEHAAVADIVDEASADCPRRQAHSIYELCGVHCPELPELLGVRKPERKRVDPLDDHEDDGPARGEECGRWVNGKLTDHCSKAGTEECAFECPYGPA